MKEYFDVLNQYGEFRMNNQLLKIKQKIVLDNEYQSWMKKISNVENEFVVSSNFNNKVALDHGIEHMDRVANNVYKLLTEYNCSKNICILGYIAGLIHDIGMINGKRGHAENGAEMSKIFLKKLDLVNTTDVTKIANAIKNHGNGGVNPDIISAFLAISDKADMCKSRSLGDLSPIQFIENYTIKIKNNVLKINYIMTDLKGKEGLYIIPKSIDIPRALGSNLGLKVEFYINGKYEKFRDKEKYKGEIYQRKE